MNDLSKSKNILRIIGYAFCVVLPLYIYSLYVSLEIFTTSTGGFMNLEPAFNGMIFIVLIIILGLVQMFNLKKIANSFGIYGSQKIIIAINIISYIVALVYLSSTIEFENASTLGVEAIYMPITLLLPVIVLAIIYFFIIKINFVDIKNDEVGSPVKTITVAFAIFIIGIVGYYNWNDGNTMSINEIQQFGIEQKEKADAAAATKISEGDITATNIEIKEESVIRLYRIFALQKIDKVLSVEFTEIFYFTNSAEEKVIVDEIAAKNKKMGLYGNSITYGRNETSNINLVYKDAEKNSKYPYEIYSSFDISVDRYGNKYRKPDLTEARLNIMNPIIKNVTEGDNISYKKLIQVFRDNGYSVTQLPDVYDDF